MKNLVKIAVAVIAAQACLASAVSAGPAAQPMVVDMAVNVVVDAPSGDLSDAAEAISAAAASGNNHKAQELLSDLFSGGVKTGKAGPVHANKCCHCCETHSPAAPAGTVAVSTSAAPAAAPVVSAPLSYADPVAESAAAAAAKAEAAKEAAKKEKEEAQKLKGFAWGVTIMTVALIFLIILL